MPKLDLKQMVQETSVIPLRSFSYPFTRLLVNRLKELTAQEKLCEENNESRLSKEVDAIAEVIQEQVRYDSRTIYDVKEIPVLISHAERFLAIFE